MKKSILIGLSVLCLILFGLSTTGFAGTISYTYDNAGRLTRADYGGGKSIDYTYDNNGNLLNRTVTAGPGADTTGPSLTITSHTDGQHVNTASILLAGTASDSGKGDSGILQVTVNGSRADNDTAAGVGTANWSKTVNLISGANSLTVVAYDNSSNQNQTTQTINVTYDIPPTAPTAQTNAATGVTASGATLNGTVNANNNSTTVTFQYGLTTAYGSTVTANQSPVTGGSNTAVSKAITGLTPNTTYHFQVAGVNAGGTANGGDLTFTTSPAAPTAQTNAASGVTASGATLNGTVNANNNSTTVTFQYGLTTAYGSTVTADQSPVTGGSNTAVSKAITGLTPNTTYHYQVIGVNAGGTANGGDLTFTTPAAVPTAQTNAASGITATGATLNGTVNPNGLLTTYCFQWGLTTAYGNTTSIQSCGSGTGNAAASAKLTGLTRNAIYHYRIVAINSLGTTYGADMTFSAAVNPLPWLELLLEK
ncbi:MAG: hypothetical protein HY879_24490 [Deltaproteobacteria bacterium]|nr:hypothetical protein [Deltaproteobacteria bacterium]